MDASDQTPSQAAGLHEVLELRLQALHLQEFRHIDVWRPEGQRNAEIPERQGCTE